MNPTKTIAAAFLAIVAIANAAYAGDTTATMKPLQGLSFHAGTMHAAGYFLDEQSTCKLVLTATEEARYEPIRHETVIVPGASARYQLTEGTSLVFACQANAQALSVETLVTTAGN